MFELTIHIPALDRLAEAVIAAAAGGAVQTKTPAPASKPAASKGTPRKEPEVERKAAEAEAAPSGDEDGTDYAALRDEATKALQALNKANGIDAVRSALDELGQKKISEVPDDELQRAIDLFRSKLD